LIDQTANIAIKGREFKIVGLDDFTAGKPKTSLMQRLTSDPTTIVLQHSPGLFHRTSDIINDQICLSGHTHGGQVTFFGKALWTPPGSGDYLAGWYQASECRLYVSRGLGTSILPIRFGARPEIAVFYF
jgi:predicted MPP superfamily phosphohydrolase